MYTFIYTDSERERPSFLSIQFTLFCGQQNRRNKSSHGKRPMPSLCTSRRNGVGREETGGGGGGEMLREARRVESRQTTTRSSDGLLPLNCRQRADGEARTDAAVHGSPCIAPTSGERQGAMTSQTNPTLFIIQSFNE